MADEKSSLRGRSTSKDRSSGVTVFEECYKKSKQQMGIAFRVANSESNGVSEERFKELVDGWKYGFVPESSFEKGMQEEMIECLTEIARARNWEMP